MNETPPSLARAIAILSSETDCMTADTSGMFMESGASSPCLYFAMGVFKDVFKGTQSAEE
jgi:hypothetical protein